MQFVTFPQDTKHGSLWDMGRGEWWEMDEKYRRRIPPTPEELEFSVSDSVDTNRGQIILKGFLTNKSAKRLEVVLLRLGGEFDPRPFGAYFDHFDQNEFIKSKPHQGPPMPPAPPPPMVLVVEPETVIEFTAVQ